MTPDRPLTEAEMRAALDWYRTVGVDLAVGEEAVDRFAATQAAQQARLGARALPAQAAAASAEAPVAINADPAAAQQLASSANTLEELRALMDAYEGCALKLRATQLVFSDGNPAAKVMLVGEAPGGEEDRQGKPFVGAAGQLLDRMLAAIGLDRDSVYIVNTVPWRPPGNRNPTAQEIAACQPFLFRQVELVAPKVLVTLGAVASQTLFDTTTGIGRLRGQWKDLTFNSHTVPALAMLHPAYLLRTPSAKQHAWRDLLALKQRLVAERISASQRPA